MKIKSFAKINLGLEILDKRENGYHEIKTIFQSINLFDLLEFRLIKEDKIILIGNNNSIQWDENNLIYKASVLLKKVFSVKRGVEIKVIKNIPAGKGLGGGSSNSAITFLALKKIWNLDIEKNKLIKLAKELGADVPYFFFGGKAIGLGRGDEIHPLRDEEQYYVLLVFPEFSISTKEIYHYWDKKYTLTSKNKESKIYKFLKDKKIRSLENDLEKVVFDLYPMLKDIKKKILKKGAELAMVSGSGSSVYGIFSNELKAVEVLAEFERKNLKCMVIPTISREKYWAEIGDLQF